MTFTVIVFAFGYLIGWCNGNVRGHRWHANMLRRVRDGDLKP